jgi:uncharacterized membrane protein YhhN
VFVIVLVVTLGLCAANWWACWTHDVRWEAITKPLATLGAIGVAVAADASGSVTVAAVVALSLCLVGDIALLPQVDRFIVGLAAFLLGHLAFLVVFASLGFDAFWMAGIGLVLCALLWGSAAIPIVRNAAARGLGTAVRTYLGVISVMCVFGWATGNVLVVVGVTSFVLSDTILGFRRFVVERPWQQVAVMVTYHAALVCLAASLTLA